MGMKDTVQSQLGMLGGLIIRKATWKYCSCPVLKDCEVASCVCVKTQALNDAIQRLNDVRSPVRNRRELLGPLGWWLFLFE